MTREFFNRLFEGKLTKEQIKAGLEEIYQRGNPIDEIIDAAEAMRRKMISLGMEQNEGNYLLDIVGTGGDRKNTINISTIAAFVAAGAGCRIAKHCNRGASSKFGSVDLLERLRIDVNLTPEKTREIIDELRIGFLYAPLYHPAMKYAAEARKEINHPTIFNFLGPLTNPASPQTLLVGAYNPKTAEKIAEALRRLGVRKALVVCSENGMDEISTTYPTLVFDVTNTISRYKIHIGQSINEDYLKVESPEESAKICRNILYNRASSERVDAIKEVVLANAGAAIYVNRGAKSIPEGILLARESILSGNARKKLEQLIRLMNK